MLMLIQVAKKLRNLKLVGIRVGYKKRLPMMSDLLASLLDNKSLTNLSLIDLGLGNSIEVREQISDLIIYNETLIKLNLRENNLCKIKPLMTNLVRNCNSNLQKLVLSANDYEMFDFNTMLELMDKESMFGTRTHFKLRLLIISNCPNLYPFEFKIKKKLDEFYQKRRKVFIQYKTDEQELVQKALKKDNNELSD
jgi:hypothetical protein